MGTLDRSTADDSEHSVLSLRDGVTLGEALSALTASGVQVLACRDERSELEEAFLRLTTEEQT
jgi:hypothetical protein